MTEFRSLGALCIWLLLAFTAPARSRRLTAVSKHPTLLPRDTSFRATRFGQTLVYADADGASGPDQRIFSAKVTLNTTHPAVVLEDYAEKLSDVVCTPGTVRIRFENRLDITSAEAAWGTDGFLVIASNSGCAEPDHHQPYNVTLATYDRDSLIATLWAKAVDMKDCTHHLHVEVGHHMSTFVRPRLQRRLPVPQVTDTAANAVTTTFSSTTVYQTANASATTAFSFSSFNVTATTSALTASETIDFNYVNKSLIPPDFSAEGYAPSYPGLDHVHLACTNCTAVGQIELVAGGFSVDMNEYVEVKDFLESGYLEFSVNGLAAYMAFELSFEPGFTLHKFNAGLPPIPLSVLSIAGLFNLGPEFRPTAPISVQLDSPVDLFFGLNLSVPDNSSIIMNFTDISSSTSTGFDQASISMLPFNYSASNLSLSLTAGVNPALVLSASVKVADVDVSGGIGVYLDLPVLSAQIKTLTNMTADCTAPAPGSNAALYGSLVNVLPSYDVGAGVLWELGVSLPGGLDYSFGGQPELLNYTRVLPTVCLAYDKQGTLVNATAAASPAKTGTAARGVDAGRIWRGGLLTLLVAVGIAVV
ncbi:hypothetical protein LTR91_002478 [Friedmanniomyces endolithicus]|uniref:Uncharacterized protein n=1 Tax=Friedmanniomyces endolithicus TaxID=329885 RepID=A0AAN6L007_9PEZI|nr:hypothetical protein LTS01_002316 [Friedmanniomyces endolithicus]KAK1010643.1 hypothetical protein LTR91_002478 [Friedmanniomyces endolithicus]KAK1030077.1 hypothetical protein LTS16_019175 [Friedmanniomyces endolithicus]